MKAVIILIMLQVVLAGSNVLYRMVAEDGMKLSILGSYRIAVGLVFIAPIAFLAERGTRTPLRWITIAQAFVSGLLVVLMQNMYSESIKLTSVTFGSAIWNIVPILTFILALLFRLENFSVDRPCHKLKAIGVAVSFGGALVLILYKGSSIDVRLPTFHLTHTQNSSLANNQTKMVIGSLMAVGSSMSFAFSLIIQAKMVASYPHVMTCTALVTFFSAVQATAYALIVDHDWEHWSLGWNIRLLTVLYVGILSYGIFGFLLTYCIKVKGPLYVSAFSPLVLILSAIASYFMLNEKLHIGSIIGGSFIICGLYLLIWGKSIEAEEARRLLESEVPARGSAIPKVPARGSVGSASRAETPRVLASTDPESLRLSVDGGSASRVSDP